MSGHGSADGQGERSGPETDDQGERNGPEAEREQPGDGAERAGGGARAADRRLSRPPGRPGGGARTADAQHGGARGSLQVTGGRGVTL